MTGMEYIHCTSLNAQHFSAILQPAPTILADFAQLQLVVNHYLEKQ
jgi:hypothetical protein